MATIRCILPVATTVPDEALKGDMDLSLDVLLGKKGPPGQRVGELPSQKVVTYQLQQEASPVLSVLVGIGAGLAGWYAYKRWIK